MLVVIAGGGRVGEELANLLLANHHEVRIVEDRRPILSLLHQEVPTEIVYEGDATDPSVLARSGLDRADVFAACTDSDDTNLVLCRFAREQYRVPRTIARVNNPRNAWLFDERFHVDVALNQPHVLAALIEEQMSAGELVTLLKLQQGKFSLVEEEIPAGCPAIGRPLRELGLPEDCVIAAILRAGKIVVPRGETTLEAGDELLAITGREGQERLGGLLSPG